METEAETEQNLVDELDERLGVQGNQEIIDAMNESKRLRKEVLDLQKVKTDQGEDAIESRNLGIKLQTQIKSGHEKVDNIQSYMNECDIII